VPIQLGIWSNNKYRQLHRYCRYASKRNWFEPLLKTEVRFFIVNWLDLYKNNTATVLLRSYTGKLVCTKYFWCHVIDWML